MSLCAGWDGNGGRGTDTSFTPLVLRKASACQAILTAAEGQPYRLGLKPRSTSSSEANCLFAVHPQLECEIGPANEVVCASDDVDAPSSARSCAELSKRRRVRNPSSADGNSLPSASQVGHTTVHALRFVMTWLQNVHGAVWFVCRRSWALDRKRRV